MLHFFEQNWFGILSILIGFLISLYFAINDFHKPRLKIYCQSTRIIGLFPEVSNNLTEELEIKYKGILIPRLTRTVYILWNGGLSTIKSDELVTKNPLKISSVKENEILSCKIIKVNNESCESVIETILPKNEYKLSFEYLPRNDGVVIEVYHTSEQERLPFTGCLKSNKKFDLFVDATDGLEWVQPSKRILFNQNIYSFFSRNWVQKFITYSTFIMGIYSLLSAPFVYFYGIENFKNFFQNILPHYSASNFSGPIEMKQNEHGWMLALCGLILIAGAFQMLSVMKLPYPKSLNFDDLEFDTRED